MRHLLTEPGSLLIHDFRCFHHVCRELLCSAGSVLGIVNVLGNGPSGGTDLRDALCDAARRCGLLVSRFEDRASGVLEARYDLPQAVQRIR